MQTVLGCVEKVSIPSLGVKDVWAKIDTGAYSGAIHCTDIKVLRNKQTGLRRLEFTPLGANSERVSIEDFKATFVRSSNGVRSRRYVISADIELKGKVYTTLIGLSDRSDMERPVLIGRRFLREHALLVDVRINEELDKDGELTRED